MDIAFARLTQLAFGYWHAQTLFTLTDAGVFDQVRDCPRSAAEIGELCGLEAAGAEALLDAGVALGLLQKRDGSYAPTELSARFLTASSPESLARWVRVMGRWFGPWADLRRCLELGRPVDSQAPRLVEDPGYLEAFILGMHEYAARSSDAVAAAIELPGATTLVDVGGGAGTYSVALCTKYPALSAVVVDQAPVLPIARELVSRAGLAHRISLRPGDYRTDAFGRAVDAVLFSNVLHQESRPVGLGMLERARVALREGGKVVVHGHFLDEDRASPVFATLHNLSARVLWEGGHSYTKTEMTALVREAGFGDIGVWQVAGSATTVIVGHTDGSGVEVR
jgi:hypothetical protein